MAHGEYIHIRACLHEWKQRRQSDSLFKILSYVELTQTEKPSNAQSMNPELTKLKTGTLFPQNINFLQWNFLRLRIYVQEV